MLLAKLTKRQFSSASGSFNFCSDILIRHYYWLDVTEISDLIVTRTVLATAELLVKVFAIDVQKLTKKVHLIGGAIGSVAVRAACMATYGDRPVWVRGPGWPDHCVRL